MAVPVKAILQGQIPNSGQVGSYSKDEVDGLLAEKQSMLTFDPAPIVNSMNPVTSAGILEALSDKAPAGYGLGQCVLCRRH